MADNHNHLVIMAGGVGSRFWPMSTQERPKQFIDVLGTGRSLLQMTLDRFAGVVPAENVWVVTNRKYFDLVRTQLPGVPVANILQEPCRRNTAPCIAYVSWRIKMADPKANIVVAPSDHLVVDTEEFRRVIIQSLQFTSETDAIVTIGIKPTRPETGYGYIQADLTARSPRNKEIFRVDEFHEKPELDVAVRYMRESNYFWNAGIFVWSVETIVNALRVYAPAINRVFEGMKDLMGTPAEQAAIDERYADCESISIDYAVLERATEIFCFPADFGWSDLGTWGSLLQVSEHDVYGNALIGQDIQAPGCRNCIVHTTQERRVVVQGLDHYIVAEHDGTLLVCSLNDEQRIKQFSGE